MNTPINVSAFLPALARQRPHAPAVVCPAGRDNWDRVAYTQYSFQQLDEVSDYFAHSLESFGVRRGMRTVLMVPPSLDFFALTFALFKLSAVLVLVDPGMGVRNLGKCLAEAAPEAFIGVPKAHLARRVLGWARASMRITVAVGRPHLGCDFALGQRPRELTLGQSASEPYPIAKNDPNETAAILFTSGSTGVAKGAVYSHENFAAQVEAIRRTFDIQPGEVDLATFPLFALFGPALGMTAIIPDMNPTRPALVDPTKIFEAIQNFGVTNLFGSPALLNRVGRAVEGSHQLPSLKRVVSAGAPVSAAVIERFVKLLPPGVQVFTPYGATEGLPVAVIGSHEILKETRFRTEVGAGVCVGRPVEGIVVKIIRIMDEPIPRWRVDWELKPGEIGEIAIQAPWVTRSYFNRPQATALAKIVVSETEFLHRMGDLGYFDDRGRLWFCGRKAHRVVTPNGTLFTIPCEGVFNTHPSVFRSALVGVNRSGATEPVLCVECEPDAPRGRKAQNRIRTELLQIGHRFQHTQGIRTILFHPAFPVDIRHNSKIFREKLAVWAAKRLR